MVVALAGACYIAGNDMVVHVGPKGGVCACGRTRDHGRLCRCATCRHARFNPGPPSMTKRQARNRAHDEALIEDAARTTPTKETQA